MKSKATNFVYKIIKPPSIYLRFSKKYTTYSDKYIYGESSKFDDGGPGAPGLKTEPFLWSEINFEALIKPNQNWPFVEINCGIGAQTPAIISRLPERTKVLGFCKDKNQLFQAKNYLYNLQHFSPYKVLLE